MYLCVVRAGNTMVSPNLYMLYYWNAFQSKIIQKLNISVPGCLYSGQVADTINTADINVWCDDDYNVSTCTFYFGARSGEETDAFLCQIPLSTGKTSPVIPQASYVPGATIAFFPTGVVVSAGSFTTRVTPSDLLVYLYPSRSYHWCACRLLVMMRANAA